MKNRLILGLALSTSLISTSCEREAKRPNLLYIFPDQYRAYALSLWSDPEYQDWISTVGDPVHTPNIDKLAREGVVFTQATSTFPVSSPHRAMFMSGMFPAQNGVDRNCTKDNDIELKQDIECFTDVLAKSGYQTAYVGKTHWHRNENLFTKSGDFVGTTEAPGGSYLNGYDTYIPEGKSRHSNQFWYQHIKDNHHGASVYTNRPEFIDNKSDGEQYKSNTFSATREADVVVAYLKNKNNERTAGAPFSIIWSINPPHPPYNSVNDCDTEVYKKYYADNSPEQLFTRENVDLTEESKQFDRRVMNAKVYYSLIKSVDDEIGRVMATLESIGEMDNTVIVFTSDHGEMMNSHRMMNKSVIYEESFVVPFIIRYPAALQHRREELLLGSTDIMPTLLGLLGLGDRVPESVVGNDYSEGLIAGEFADGDRPKTAPYIAMSSKGVRSDRYTFAVSEDGSYLLYDNIKDPYQTDKLKLSEIPQQDAAMLQRELGIWLAKADDEWCNQRLNSNIIKY